MTTLAIRDLPEMKELDSKAMSDTSGGIRYLLPWLPVRRIVVPQNNVNFGSGNSFAGITTGVNNGNISGNTFNF